MLAPSIGAGENEAVVEDIVNAEDFQILKMMPKPKVMVWADLEIANPYLIYFGTSRTP
jgi:hypothetical protein